MIHDMERMLYPSQICFFKYLFYFVFIFLIPPPQIWNLIHNVMVSGGRSHWKEVGLDVRTFMNMIRALLKEIPKSSPICPTRWEHSKTMAICEPGSRSPLDAESAGAIVLDFLEFKIVTNKYWCVSHQYVILL